MVQLFIKEHTSTTARRMIVKNEKRQDVFMIDGRWGSKGDKLKLYTLRGVCLMELDQKTLSVYPKFRLKVGGYNRGYIKKKHRLLRGPYYDVTHYGWRATGDFKKMEYTVSSKTHLIMTVDKAMTSFGDFYTLDIKEPSDAPLCCLLAVIIDHYSVNKDRHRRRQHNYQQILQRQN